MEIEVVSFNSGGVLTLIGSDTLAHYQAALRSITFSAGEHPINYGSDASRTITWTVNDGQGSNNTGTAISTVSITNVNDAPTMSGTANASYTEEGVAVTLSGGISVSDPDNLNLAGATVAISAGLFTGDTLNFTNQNNITGSYSGGRAHAHRLGHAGALPGRAAQHLQATWRELYRTIQP